MKEIRVEEDKWSKFQTELRDSGLTNSDVENLERQAKLTELISTLQSHNGPLNTEEALDTFLTEQRNRGTKEEKSPRC